MNTVTMPLVFQRYSNVYGRVRTAANANVVAGEGLEPPDPRIMIPGMATDTGRQTATGRLDKSPKTLKFVG
jgi:hypothetical protein